MERSEIIAELEALREKVKKAEFVNPVDIRRIDKLRSLLLSDGKSENLTATPSKPRHTWYGEGLKFRR